MLFLVEAVGPLQQGLRRRGRRYLSLQEQVEAVGPLQQGLRLDLFFLHNSKFLSRSSRSTTTGIATRPYKPLSFSYYYVEAVGPLQQGLRLS